MKIVFRTSLITIGTLGAIFAPPLVPLICMGLLAFRYPSSEVLLIGLLVDFLWLPSGPIVPWADAFTGLPLFLIAAFILAWGLEPLRREFLFQ